MGGKKIGERQKHGEGRIALTAEVVPLQHTRCLLLLNVCVRVHSSDCRASRCAECVDLRYLR